MSGRPDYDVGDLVVCVTSNSPFLGRAYQVEAIFPPGTRCGLAVTRNWGVVTVGFYAPNDLRAWAATAFRKLDPKPPEFFTGNVEADQRDRVLA